MTCPCGTPLAARNPGPLCYACSGRKFIHHVLHIDTLGPVAVHSMPAPVRNPYMTRPEAKLAEAKDLAVKRTQRLVQSIAADTDYAAEEVLKTRVHITAKYRQAIALILSEECKLSSKAIGHALQIDHATVLHGITKARERIAENVAYADLVRKWRAELREEIPKKEAA